MIDNIFTNLSVFPDECLIGVGVIAILAAIFMIWIWARESDF